MRKLLREIDRIIDRGESFVLASIVHSSGSTPRTSGARMLIFKDGTITGTVGGGQLEARVREFGKTVWNTHRPIQEKLVFSGKDASASDMICGGEVEVLVEWVSPENVRTCTAIDDIRRDVSHLGAVYIFGAGHVSQALAQITHLTNFYTVVIDDRSEYANQSRFPEAEEIITPDPIEAAFQDLLFNENSYIVIVTRGHLQDKVVLEAALGTSAGYIGMIGSKRKCALIYDELRKSGWSNTDFARIKAPIGLSIGGETPEEIAVSIAAEMIQYRASKNS